MIHGDLSADLLRTIFSPRSPLHDGAVIVRGTRILAAGALLPLGETTMHSERFGTRHRAALGHHRADRRARRRRVRGERPGQPRPAGAHRAQPERGAAEPVLRTLLEPQAGVPGARAPRLADLRRAALAARRGPLRRGRAPARGRAADPRETSTAGEPRTPRRTPPPRRSSWRVSRASAPRTIRPHRDRRLRPGPPGDESNGAPTATAPRGSRAGRIPAAPMTPRRSGSSSTTGRSSSRRSRSRRSSMAASSLSQTTDTTSRAPSRSRSPNAPGRRRRPVEPGLGHPDPLRRPAGPRAAHRQLRRSSASVDLSDIEPTGEPVSVRVTVEAVDPSDPGPRTSSPSAIVRHDRPRRQQEVPIRAVLLPLPSGLDAGEPTVERHDGDRAAARRSIVDTDHRGARRRWPIDASGIDVNQLVTLVPVDDARPGRRSGARGSRSSPRRSGCASRCSPTGARRPCR